MTDRRELAGMTPPPPRAGNYVRPGLIALARRLTDITSLVHDLLAASEEFRGLWERHQVGVRRADLKTFIHPEVGAVAVRCEVLLTEKADVKLLAYFPAEGTDAAEKLELLRVIGTQRLSRADSSPT